jgi:hypothetical protein
MSYPALEVELRNGRVVACNGEALPSSARALLVLLESDSVEKEQGSDLLGVLTRIRSRQTARGHVPRSVEAVRDQVERERESWD